MSVEANFQIARSRLPLLRRGPAWVIGVQLVCLVAAYLLPALVVELGAAMVRGAQGLSLEPTAPAEIATYERWMDVLVVPAVGLGLLAFGWWLARVASAQGVGPDTAVLVRRPWVRRLAAVGLAGLAVALPIAVWGTAAPQWESWLRDLHRHAGPDVALRWGEGLFLLGILVIWPIGEELFFRGWVWNALRGFWSQPVVMGVTGFIFLVAAASANPEDMLILLPSTIAFTVARALGGLRSAILCHLVYVWAAVIWVLSSLIVVRF